MAEITRKRTGELLRGVFEVLMKEPEGLPAREIIKRVEEKVPPTDFENSEYPNRPGVRRFPKIIRFGTIAPVKAGWLEKNRGEWRVTDAGREAYKKFKDPEQFRNESVRLYKAWKLDQDDQPEEAEKPTESDEASTTIEEAEESAWAELAEHLGSMNPYDFQQIVAGLVDGMGYHVQWVAPPGPDKGIDVLATQDPLGADGPRLKVQVKRQQEKVSVSGVRSFLAVLGENDVGLFVCTGGFTRDAENEARHQEKRRIVLFDAKEFFDRWVEFYDRIPESSRVLMPIRPVWYLAF